MLLGAADYQGKQLHAQIKVTNPYLRMLGILGGIADILKDCARPWQRQLTRLST